MKRILFTALKLTFFFGLGLLLIWLSLRGLSPSDKDQIWQSFRDARYHWVVLSMLVGIGSHYIRALRWNLLIETFGPAPRVRNTFLAVMSGYLANLAIPRLGEVTRCSILYKTDRTPVDKSLGTVLTERSIDLFMFAALFALTLLWQIEVLRDYVNSRILSGFEEKIDGLQIQLLWILSGIAAAVFILFILLRNKLAGLPVFIKLKNVVKGFYHGLISVVKVRKPWLFIGYTLLIWVMYFLMVYLCFFALRETSHLGLAAGFAVLTLGTVGIIVTPGGIGLYPLIVAETLLLYGVDYNIGFAMGWIAWTSQTVLIIIAGTISLVFAMTKTQKDADTRVDPPEDTERR